MKFNIYYNIISVKGVKNMEAVQIPHVSRAINHYPQLKIDTNV